MDPPHGALLPTWSSPPLPRAPWRLTLCGDQRKDHPCPLPELHPTRWNPRGHRQSRGNLVYSDWAEWLTHLACPGPAKGRSARHEDGVRTGQPSPLGPPNRTGRAPGGILPRATCPRLHRASSPPPTTGPGTPPATGSVEWRPCEPTPGLRERPTGKAKDRGPLPSLPLTVAGVRCGWAASCRGSGCPWGPGGP